MSDSYDVIVLGLGGMGSAAAYHVASRGRRVLGIEQFGPAHDFGSSHGDSRIYRQSYAEDPAYVPLLLRARELWRQLNVESGQEVFTATGGIMIGREDSAMVSGSLRSARHWDLRHEILTAERIRHRFPTLTPADDEVGFYEQAAGLVRPELAVAAHLRLASAKGAALRFHEPAVAWGTTSDGGAWVTTDQGSYRADRLILAPGAWSPALLADLPIPIRVERRVMYWFAAEGGVGPFTPDRHPIYVWESPDGRELYGFPAIDGPNAGIKVAFHNVGESAHPETLDRQLRSDEVAAMRQHLRTRVPALAGPLIRGAVCLYSNTPDEHFVLSPHPEHEQVTVACGFSGHGFKFVPAIGEVLADLATEGTTDHPIELFDATRTRAPQK